MAAGLTRTSRILDGLRSTRAKIPEWVPTEPWEWRPITPFTTINIGDHVRWVDRHGSIFIYKVQNTTTDSIMIAYQGSQLLQTLRWLHLQELIDMGALWQPKA